jgi:hypothetical protein
MSRPVTVVVARSNRHFQAAVDGLIRAAKG